MDWAEFDALTDEQVAEAVARDPDAIPSTPEHTPEQLARMRRVSPARRVRQKLAMSHKKFAQAYGIPIETLLKWERHEAEPTVVELAYLLAI